LEGGEGLNPGVASLVVLGAEDVIGVLLLLVEGANEEGVKVSILARVGGAR
jgi:hypothetical protein